MSVNDACCSLQFLLLPLLMCVCCQTYYSLSLSEYDTPAIIFSIKNKERKCSLAKYGRSILVSRISHQQEITAVCGREYRLFSSAGQLYEQQPIKLVKGVTSRYSILNATAERILSLNL